MAKSKNEESKKSKSLLEDSDSSSSEEEVSSDDKKEVRFSINADYAQQYESRKQREELMKERQLKGDSDSGEDDTDSESSSSDEDEDADLLTTKLDVDILKTINALRTKDEKIYNPNVRFFPGSDEESEGDEEGGQRTKKHKPKRVKDVLREQILQQIEEEEEGNNKTEATHEKTTRLAYDEQQQELRKAFLDSDDKQGDGDDSDGEEDNFLVIKKRHTHDKEDPEIKNQLDLELKNLEESVLKTKKDKKSSEHQLVDPRGEVEDGEKFLLDFIKNKAWVDKNEDVKIPHDSDDDNDIDDEQSLEELEKADDFEAKYNFRFEEAIQQAESRSGAEHSIQGYARSQTMNTLRRKDETRREKRLARKERKAAERKAKEEKLRRLKNAKKEEIERKMKQVRAVLGAGGVTSASSMANAKDGEAVEALQDAPIDEAAIMKLLEGDFDPEKFEASMQQAFGEDFYQKEDAEWKTDEDVQRTLKDDEEVDYTGMEKEDEGASQDMEEPSNEEEGEGHDDARYDGNDDVDNETKKEETVMEQKLRAKMMDKLYELDYEDIVGGMPTRFKYREVEANNYGLSTEEILLARDSTLKQLVSLKKMAPYREGEEYRVSSRKRRKFREMLQQDIEDAEKRLKEQGITVNDNHDNDEGGTGKKKKRRRIKKGAEKEKITDAADDGGENEKKEDGAKEGAGECGESTKKRRRKKKGKKLPNMSGTQAPTKVDIELDKKVDENGSNRSYASPSKPERNDKKAVGLSKVDTKNTEESDAKKLKKRKKKKKKSLDGVSAARLASYDL